MKNTLFILFIGLFISCSSSKKQVDDNFDTATAFAVKDGKIIAIGNDDEIESQFQAKAIFDAEGKTIVPGLIDAHAHLYGYGLSLQNVDLNGTESPEEALERVVEFHKKHPNNFITGRGWDQNKWPNKEFPTKEMLDELFPDIPVALRRVDGHAMWVNSKALELAGITAETKMPGGEVVLKNGEPSGILIDSPMQLVNQALPQPNQATSIQALLEAEKVAVSYGLTTIDDAGLDRGIVELIDSLQQTGEMKLKVYAMLANTPANRKYYLDKGIHQTDRLNVRSFKVFTDGALGSRGAAMKAEYSDMHNHFGAMITPADSLEYLAQLLAKTDFQMNSHAIGDSANISVLRTYDNALKGLTDKRWRVEHAQIISLEDFDYFSNNILPSVQPTHATSDMYWAEDRVGSERIKGAYAYKTLLEKSGIVALGTDFPVEEVNPMYTFYAAVARKDLKHWPENGFQIEQALSREEALRGMTIWAAYSNFEEKEKGSIEIGKWADFTVLDADLMKVEESQLPLIQTLSTFINGEKVYSME